MSPLEQALPSLQAPPLGANTQPLAGLQLSLVHTLPSLQLAAGPGAHLPPEQPSLVVQALPSLQAAALALNTQPLAGLQLSLVQPLLSSQVTPLPLHAPPLQVSPLVQALLSVQGALLLANTQPLAGLQLSLVHTLLSLHGRGAPPWHCPPEQASPLVHALLSLQAAVLGV